MERVLVTGGAGYVGSHTVALLCDNGYEVDVVDNLYTGHSWAIPNHVKHHNISLLDSHSLKSVFEEKEYSSVIHFAARSLVGESMANPYEYFHHNISASLNLLQCMAYQNVRRIVFSSTANIFDAIDTELIGEKTQINPGSPYGESKYITERILEWSKKLNGINYVSLRYFNAAGAMPNASIGECHNPETHLIPLIFSAALGEIEKLTVYGNDYATRDGTCIRDFVHVCDLAKAHLLALEKTKYESLSCNLGTGKGHTVLEVINAAQQICDLQVPYEIGPRRPGDPAMLVADPTLALSELNWEMDFSNLEFILQSAWRWHAKHQ